MCDIEKMPDILGMSRRFWELQMVLLAGDDNTPGESLDSKTSFWTLLVVVITRESNYLINREPKYISYQKLGIHS